MALTAIVVIILAGSVSIFEIVYDNLMERKMEKKRNKKISELTQEYQKYLDGVAATIAQEPVNQNLISQVNSYVFNKSPQTNLYLWMNDNKGEFVFGVPSADFTRLNKAFDKSRASIEKEGYYVDRNDYLLKTVGEREKERLIRFGEDVQLTDFSFHTGYRSGTYRSRHDNHIIVLSSPIVDAEQQVSAELYLKVDDSELENMRYYYRTDIFSDVVFPVAHGILGFAAFFLWLLLPSWVYIDARQREVKRAFMWAMLTVVTFGFAWAIYLISRPTTVTSFLCPECEKELNGTKAFCPYCGYDLSSTFCPQCQYQVKPDWQFCPSCRYDLTSQPANEGDAEYAREDYDPPYESESKEKKENKDVNS